MGLDRAPALSALAALAMLAGAAPASAISGVPGGATAPASPQAGGSQYGVQAQVAQIRPVVSELIVPASSTAGRPPPVSLRIDERGVGTVYVQVSVIDLVTRTASVVATLGWSHTGRALRVRWPHGATLAPGSYRVTVTARDHHHISLLRRAHSSGRATLTVNAPAPAPPTAPSEAGVPTPAQTVAAGAVFPVQGSYSFGNSENRFGAARAGHVHQGQDVLTAEGTPVVAPMSGAITWTSYQAGGAGYYAVEHTALGLDFMFAHCEAGSLLVAAGQGVSAGQPLCKAGQTGDATAPHLHFEIWVGGWQAAGGRPVDPLPYLQAW